MAAALETQKIGDSFFEWQDHTTLCWLGSAGVLINTGGTVLLIDPIVTLMDRDGEQVSETGHRLRVPFPIEARDLPRVDAVLYTHADGDHFGRRTAAVLERKLTPQFVSPPPVRERLGEMGVPELRLTPAPDGETFRIGEANVEVTPALHDWQKQNPWRRGDCCGYLIKTPDGTIWHPGDSRLLDELLAVKGVDVLFFDVAPVNAHLGPEGSARLAETCGARDLIAYHYGTFDVAPGGPFGSDPDACLPLVEKLPARFHLLNPGEIFSLPNQIGG